jgi:CheY-like chemotaxis protein/signal transduction histidine kinase
MIANLGVAGLGAAGIVVDHLPAERRLANDHFILAISTVILFAIAWLYERMKDAAQRHIYELEAARQTAELERVQAVSRSQLAEAQRLASLGRIASATAHEINSPLSTVIANLQLAAETATPRVAESIEAALAAARRISTIVADMNQHARPRVESGTISVRDAVVAATKLAQPHIHARAHVTHSVPGDLPRVVADNGLTDILVNLLVNAAEMLPEGQASSHAIAIGARAVERSVVIEVTQTDSPTAQLGLAMCHSIVDKLGGTLVIDAHVARLTLVAAKPVTTTPAVASPRLAILIVDDDESILGTLERVLSNHAITVANGGRDALGLCAAVEFDLVISDLMMPQLTGMDLYAQLVASDASYADRFVFMTGGTFTERAEEFRTTVTSPFIEKPFNLGELRQVIARFGPRAAATAA